MIFFIISFYVISYFIYFSAVHKRTLSSQYYNIITKFMCSKSAQLRKRSVLLLWTDKFQQAHHRNRTYTKHPYDTVSVIWTSCVNPTQAICSLKCSRIRNKTNETNDATVCSETPLSENLHRVETSQLIFWGNRLTGFRTIQAPTERHLRTDHNNNIGFILQNNLLLYQIL